MGATLNLGISMNQGDDFNLVLLINGPSGPIDITGYDFLGEMKSSTASTYPVIAEFDFTILNQTTNKGQIQWNLPSAETLALVTSPSDPEQTQRQTTPYVFDVKMQDLSFTVTRIVQGIIYVSPAVTLEVF